MSGWSLGIDFGTSYTVAAVTAGGSEAVLDVEASGRTRIPSAVFLAQDGTILVGSGAQHQAVFAPDRYEPTPKRSLGQGELFLGDRLVPVTDLVGAVLRRVYVEACRQQGERTPDALVVTHPAEWTNVRLALLDEAVQKAGLPQVTFIPEPVAAAARIALAETAPGQRIAVYDFGGGTFDAAVLLRTAAGFEVAGPPAGRDPLGGEDIDDDIITHLGAVLADEFPESWESLCRPPDVSWRRDSAAFRSEVQRAKETLSEATVCQLWVPGIGREVQLTRTELNTLIGPVVEDTVTTLEAAIRDAGATPADLAGVYLVGGSSRIPLVAETIWRRMGVRPSVEQNPKSVVALGAAAVAAASAVPASVPAAASQPVAPAPQPALITLATFLAMSLELDAWPPGSDCAAHLTIDRPGPPPLTIRARDEPAQAADAVALSELALATRRARTPGFREVWHGPADVLGHEGIERRFIMETASGDLPMVEQYLVIDDRSVVVAGPESARAVIDSMTYGERTLPGEAWFESRFGGGVGAEWTVHEQLVLQRRVTQHRVTTTRRTSAGGVTPDQWRAQHLAPLLRMDRAAEIGQVSGRVFNQLEGEIATVGYYDPTYVLAKAGLTILGGHGLAVVIALPHAEQAAFPDLARHAWLHPNLGRSG